MQIEVSVAYFYMCVVYLNYRYYVKAAGEMLFMWYLSTLYTVIYSLNCDMFHESVFRLVRKEKIGEAVVDSARHPFSRRRALDRQLFVKYLFDV